MSSPAPEDGSPTSARFERWEAWLLLGSAVMLIPAGFVVFLFSAESHSKTYYSPMIGWVIPAVGIALARVIVGRANRRQHLPFFPSGSAAMTSDFDDVVSAARRVGVPVSVVVAVGLIGATGIAWGLYKASQTVMLP